MAVRQHTPGGQHRLARLPQMQPLGEAVDVPVSVIQHARRTGEVVVLAHAAFRLSR